MISIGTALYFLQPILVIVTGLALLVVLISYLSRLLKALQIVPEKQPLARVLTQVHSQDWGEIQRKMDTLIKEDVRRFPVRCPHCDGSLDVDRSAITKAGIVCRYCNSIIREEGQGEQ